MPTYWGVTSLWTLASVFWFRLDGWLVCHYFLDKNAWTLHFHCSKVIMVILLRFKLFREEMCWLKKVREKRLWRPKDASDTKGVTEGRTDEKRERIFVDFCWVLVKCLFNILKIDFAMKSFIYLKMCLKRNIDWMIEMELYLIRSIYINDPFPHSFIL